MCAHLCCYVCVQNPLPYMLYTRSLLLTTHGVALAVIGVSHPFVQSATMHTVGLALNVCVRLCRLKAWKRTGSRPLSPVCDKEDID